MNKKICYIVDIDGTIAIRGDRSPYEWAKVGLDTPNQPIIDILTSLFVEQGAIFIFVSGRDGSCEKETREWIKKYIPIPLESTMLLMREAGNTEPDYIIKERIYRKSIDATYNVLAVFDDRNSVVKMWRSIGLTCLQVAEGDF